MQSGYKRQQECEPAPLVRTFKAAFKTPRGKKAKLGLIPAQLKTPKNKRHPGTSANGTRSGGTSRRGHTSGTRHDEPRLREGGDQDDMWDNDVHVHFDLPTTSQYLNTPNAYMRDWKLNKERLYLREVIERDGLPLTPTCSQCQHSLAAQPIWRCKDCLGPSLFCTSCCGHEHRRNPFHRVEVWSETHFRPSWLWRAGVTLSLCSSGACSSNSDDEENQFHEAPPPLNATDRTYGAKPEGCFVQGLRVLVVVHTNGIHHLPCQFCECDGHPDEDVQLLCMGFYPASHKEVRTVFTFALLDQHLLENLECYTSSMHFYSKLRRLTNKIFPKKTPDRYREGLRCGRQWRRLKELKHFGFGHREGQPTTGDLALYCSACPQVGINLPLNWQDDTENTWKYSISLAADGNFSLVHRKQKGTDDVWLKNGEGFLVAEQPYGAHLVAAAPREKERDAPTCHEHRAVEDRSKTHKGCDATGVGAFACSHHGAFAPNSVVDFQKGERQMNMDYGLSGSIASTKANLIGKLNLLYDINCQYSVHLRDRFESGKDYLTLPPELEIVYAIGKFHVHGHQESCYARYSPMFVQGIGWTSGEILESLWSVLNEAAPETLDALINDSNWKKMLNLVPWVAVMFEKSYNSAKTAQEDFELLNKTASEDQRARWKDQLDGAMRDRVDDVQAMDILTVSLDKSPSRAKVQHDLMQRELNKGSGLGVTLWLSLGIKIQEAQMQLKVFIRALPRVALRTDLQILEVSRKREQIQMDNITFCESAQRLFPSVKFDEYTCFNPPETNPEIENAEPEAEGTSLFSDNPFIDTERDAEDLDIPLPSSFDELPPSLSNALHKEAALRIVQANDALEGVRSDIGHKSFLYRSNIRLADGKKQCTRGYAAVKATDKSMRHHIRMYNQAVWALKRIGADAAVLEGFRPITGRDTKAITAIYKPNAIGQSQTTLSWIWTVGVQAGGADSPYLEELYRVNWLKAKCRAERWQEEHILLRSEMDWICNFYKHKEHQCEEWARDAMGGQKAYAHRQADMWNLLRCEAIAQFRSATSAVDRLVAEQEIDDDD
ncbi:hypothetical protein BKA70DRAFT_1379996 [Coprinopsis sp. MPI-PUGE-AT-0042]|nr:hypothetical protein BKA70DRAFT_1379996 [Coprinopsis sp. MPI-PUGE-AT-0042]